MGSTKRATIYFEPEIHRALRLKAATSDRSISDMVNDAVKRTLAEDADDLQAIEKRKREPNLDFEQLAAALSTQIQLDDETYAAVRRKAYAERRSISAVVRDALGEKFGAKKGKKRLSLASFPFVGARSTRQGKRAPVSERHDEALAEALYDEHHD
jgi:plasmid stability protein